MFLNIKNLYGVSAICQKIYLLIQLTQKRQESQF